MKITAIVLVFAISLQFATAAHSDDGPDCHALDGLVNNIDARILGACSVQPNCTGVDCIESPFPMVGNSSITVLPCALPQPSLNLLVYSENGIVVGNFTSYTDEMNQELRVPVSGGFLSLYILDWTIQYNEAESSLTFQLNGTDVNSEIPAPVVNSTTIVLDRSVCAGAPEMKLMLSVAMLSLLIALLV